MEETIIPRSFGTHDGSFHADEVTTAALLILCDLIDKDKIKRSRDPTTLSRCEYVCDVEGVYDPLQKKFDHHQIEYTGPLSSAGMVLKYLKDEKIIESNLSDYFNRTLILGVDAHDNGVAKLEMGYCSFSQVISNFLPIQHTCTSKDFEIAFYKALDFALGHLMRLKERFLYTQSCKEKVQKAMASRKKVLEFDEPLPWMENFFNLGGEQHPALFVIMPTGVHWKLKGVPPNLKDRMKVRKPMPSEWAGLHNKDLREKSGIEGAIFCHKGLFISIWKTREAVLQAYAYIMGEKP